MALSDRLRKICIEVLRQDLHERDVLTEDEIIETVQDALDVVGQTAKGYMGDLKRKELIRETGSFMYEFNTEKVKNLAEDSVDK